MSDFSKIAESILDSVINSNQSQNPQTASNNVGAALNQLLTQLPPVLKPIVATYAPVLHRLSMNNFLAFVDNLSKDNSAEAQAVLRSGMTADELAKEKAELADLLVALASDSYKTREFAKSVLNAALNVTLSVVTGFLRVI